LTLSNSLYRNSSCVGHKVDASIEAKNDGNKDKTSEEWLNQQLEEATERARIKMAEEHLNELNEKAHLEGDEDEIDLIETLRKDLKTFVAENKEELDQLLLAKDDKMDTDDVKTKRAREDLN